MDRIAALPTATKLVLGGGALLLLDLFLTWQNVKLDFGPKLNVTQGQDGWDFWGLLIALAIISLITIVVIRETDAEVLLDSRWDLAPLVLGGLVFVMAVVKNLRDVDSAWASYLGVVLATVVAVGAFIDWSRSRSDEVPVHAAWRPQPAGPSATRPATPERSSDESRAKW